jgi:hypothetical protein
LRLAASRCSLDELDQRPAVEAEVVVVGGALGGGERLAVAAETVVEHGRCVLSQRDRPSLAPFGGVFAAGLDQLQRLGLLAAPGSEHERGVPERRVASCLGDRVCLLDQGLGSGELAGMHVHACAIRGREREHVERACVAGELQLAGRELVPRLVLPEVGCDAAREPEPAGVVLGVASVSGHGVERLPQWWHARRVAVGETTRQAVQEEVDRSCRPRPRRRGSGRLSYL